LTSFKRWAHQELIHRTCTDPGGSASIAPNQAPKWHPYAARQWGGPIPGLPKRKPLNVDAILASMSADPVRQQAVGEFVGRLRRAVAGNILDLRLFGSEARHEARPESDIDVLIVVQPEEARVQLEDRAIDIAFDVNLLFGVYISPRVVTAGILNDPVWGQTPFIRNVLRESIQL
jgi:predicted nucleotidyltransferase